MNQNYSATTQEPKEPKKLTPPRVKVLLAQPSDAWRHISDGHVDGLALRISPSGFGSWAVDYTRPAGGRARYTLGPEAEITLAKARELALGIRDRARRGEDPHHDKRAARTAAPRVALAQEAQNAFSEPELDRDRVHDEPITPSPAPLSSPAPAPVQVHAPEPTCPHESRYGPASCAYCSVALAAVRRAEAATASRGRT